ncbi:hypothetical protein MC885_005370 [Smutsia gigantea]|nr:hypothetical protein MC885_005370 [Smutsia gigantea]
MRLEPNDADSFSFHKPEIMGCTGCQMDWKKGKNITLKPIKGQKHKESPEVPKSGDLDAAAEAILAADFEICHFLRDRIIPVSVLYFPGEATENVDDDYYEEVKK